MISDRVVAVDIEGCNIVAADIGGSNIVAADIRWSNKYDDQTTPEKEENVIKPHLKIQAGHCERSEHGPPGFSGVVWCSMQTSWPKFCVF